jgi:hypothetical protein
MSIFVQHKYFQLLVFEGSILLTGEGTEELVLTPYFQPK